eukprot:CAMPEP_0114572566 /NCGR_PEP_ID=MMETSP0114-20121206/18371_1 /TAXON_ID=31324 /ORGANISM="Goniomonas sp, Strain m" /LENGTH=215 /DNA_ID=CAMNT_0001759807 /DNA_START=14 /DNA_END=658 /DNA_ORIENTATION=+
MSASSAQAYRQFVQQQQSSGVIENGREKKTSFVNYENTMGQFSFNTATVPTEKDFLPQFSTAVSPSPQTGISETFLAVSLTSKFDGSGMAKYGRPALDLVFALDISGSMGSRFQFADGAEEQNSSKLEVAKRCLLCIAQQLQPDDRLGIVVFNHTATTLRPLSKWSPASLPKLRTAMSRLNPCGGTDLGAALDAATEAYGDGDMAGNRSSRIFFL